MCLDDDNYFIELSQIRKWFHKNFFRQLLPKAQSLFLIRINGLSKSVGIFIRHLIFLEA